MTLCNFGMLTYLPSASSQNGVCIARNESFKRTSSDKHRTLATQAECR